MTRHLCVIVKAKRADDEAGHEGGMELCKQTIVEPDNCQGGRHV